EAKAAQRRARHRAADAFDNAIDATAGRYPANAFGETFRAEVNHVFETKRMRLLGFCRTAGRRNHRAGTLRPCEHVGRGVETGSRRRPLGSRAVKSLLTSTSPCGPT